jgi:hypothetical protein
MREHATGNAAFRFMLLACAPLALGGCGSGVGDNTEYVDNQNRIEDRALEIDNSASIGAPTCAPADCAALGGFTPAFVEPLIDPAGAAAPESPDVNPLSSSPGDDRCIYGPDERPIKCKPTAGSVAVLNDGRVLYFNALEGTERVEYSIFFEAGHALQNDQTRVLALDGDRASWTLPAPNDAGAENPDDETLTGGVLDNNGSELRDNDGALFCADLATLADGRVLAVGGTDYYNEPGVDGPFPLGVSELEGLRNARIFDPADNSWTQTGSMAHGRWYPSVVSLPSGDVFVASGVTKLVKPVYPDAPEQSGTNVRQTETYDLCTGQWAVNGATAERSLPLYPRLHLLPDGQVLYNAAGQAFNPFGQSYDQATWNFVAAYDPATRAWSELAYAGLPAGTTDPTQLANLAQGAGFRGSTFSMMLPLAPDADGNYTKAEFLTAGGVTGGLVLTNPGLNQPTAQSRIDTVTLGGAPALPGLVGGTPALGYSSRSTGPMNAARWYGTGVLLPTGEVMVFSGADRDEVQVPGTGMPIVRTERFDPATETWLPMAEQGHPRTYHNTATLLPDGRVLVGGHAPINTAYAWSISLPGFSPNDGRDPSFEIYSPPYMFGPRPSITSSDPKTLRAGEEFTLTTHEADAVTAAVLVRRTDLTHLVDADQRAVLLPIVARNAGKELRLRMPRQGAVVPPGEYMLFIVAPGPNGPAPSVSLPVTVPADRNC